ncbi:hypothetical protein HPK19_03900 [Arthrobacter citreus]|nr:hypothetical protein HPK19_03900 [Arthrobacter citreus]
MKKLNLIVVSITLLVFILAGCINNTKKTVKEEYSLSITKIAYDSLDAGDRNELLNDKPDGVVERKVVTKDIAHLIDMKYDGKEVYAVTFKVKNSDLLGDITVYFDGEKQKVIGRGYRE